MGKGGLPGFLFLAQLRESYSSFGCVGSIKQQHADGCRDPGEKGGGAKRRGEDLNQPLGPSCGDISITRPGVTSPGSQPNLPCPAKEQHMILGC